jgi:hypothetical protein
MLSLPRTKFPLVLPAHDSILTASTTNTHLASSVRRGTTDSFLLAWRRSMVVARLS